ncbi:DUF2141 domain-containing protein [Dysgonomonas sp. 521]|uniref:DUF2141 domain-containing protein n=1 Tax=Dysgonomonas sp. 521 TaxID=2302932 RepID=UPI0013D16E75|nr:DUF2141 domain-containing protein [Dysgonomonas sp. 521]NDV94724.1 DUF2141 domain-containing protein [Dysgonomonas sp. 521]
MKSISLSIILLLSVLTATNAQNSITLNITNIEDQSGKLYIAVYNPNVPFLSDKAISGKIIDVTGQTAAVTFENLEEGEYAIAMFHDKNNNEKLDLGKYGIPTEKYGFSNNVDPALSQGSPAFEECKFDVKGNTCISIKLISAIK